MSSSIRIDACSKFLASIAFFNSFNCLIRLLRYPLKTAISSILSSFPALAAFGLGAFPLPLDTIIPLIEWKVKYFFGVLCTKYHDDFCVVFVSDFKGNAFPLKSFACIITAFIFVSSEQVGFEKQFILRKNFKWF